MAEPEKSSEPKKDDVKQSSGLPPIPNVRATTTNVEVKEPDDSVNKFDSNVMEPDLGQAANQVDKAELDIVKKHSD